MPPTTHQITNRCLFGVLIVILLAGALAPSVASGQPPLAKASTHRRLTSLEAHPLQRLVQETGSVRLIVGLNVESQPEGFLANAAAVSDQRTRIAQAQEALVAELAPFGVTVGKRFTYVPGLVLEVDEAGLDYLLRSPIVRSLMVDELFFPQLDESVDLIDADQLHDLDQIGTGQTIAILDTGVNSAHPFLSGKVVAERCVSTTAATQNASTICPNGQDEQSGTGAGRACSLPGCEHGTHVAGIAAGGSVGSGNAPASGVAPGARLIAVQVFSRLTDEQPTANRTPCADRGRASPCMSAFFSDVIVALERVFELRTTFKIAAVNLSLGAGSRTSVCDTGADIPKSTIDNLLSVGIATVVSAGNNSRRDAIGSPACISSVVSVGATTKSDGVADYSDISSFVTLLAPGSDIRSSLFADDFVEVSGTSMAAPHVAGAIALLKAARPAAPISEIITALRTTGPIIRDTRSGGTVSKRRLNVRQALAALGAVDTDDYRVMSVGQSLAGVISPATEQDIYYFDATAGQQVTIRMAREGKGTLNSFITLFAPNGRALVSDDNGVGFNGDALINLFTLPDTGRYRLRATSSGGLTSGGYTLSLSATASSSNPVPRITFLTPNSTALSPSTTSITARVNGYNFVPGAIVRLDSTNVATTFLSSTQLSVRVLASQIPGTSFPVRVLNPTPGGGLSNAATFTISPSSVGESELSPSEGASTIGITTTYLLTWTHPVAWRQLSSLDLRLRNLDNEMPLWIRFTEGTTSTLYLLNAAETLVDRGVPGEARVLESETARLYLAESTIQGTGADGPSVTLTLKVAFKGEALGRYNLELLALDDTGAQQGPDILGSWEIKGTHTLYLPLQQR